MNPIVLHIGATKTGSSSLQFFLAQHRDALAGAGYCYPEAGRGSQDRSAHHNLFYETRTGDQGNDDFARGLGGWPDALAEIDARPQTGVISSEAFQYATRDQVRRIFQLLSGRAVSIVIYLRRRDLWLQSAWNQRARFGRVGLRFEDFLGQEGRVLADYAEMLAPWIDVFGDDSVDVRMYDGLGSGEGIVDDFAGSYLDGVDRSDLPDEAERRNSKAGLKHLLAVSMVNSICRERLGDGFCLARRSAVRISAYFRDRPDDVEYSPITYDDALAISRFFRDSDFRLAEMSTSFRNSSRFPEPRPDEFGRHVDMSDPATLAAALFDPDERRFVERMSREVVKATPLVTGATS